MLTQNSRYFINLVSLLMTLEVRPQTSDYLALKFQCFIRTIMRSIDLLRCGGFPVIVNDQNEYELVSNYGVPKVVLTEAECQAPVKHLEQDDIENEVLRSALDKLKMKLP